MSNSWPLSDIVSKATAGLGNREDITLSDASFWANESHRFLWDTYPHDQQELIAVSSTTSGERTLVKPAGFLEMLNIQISSSTGTTTASNESKNGLQPLNYFEYDALSVATGRPTHYLDYGEALELYPTPDSSFSLQMRYKGSAPIITALTEVPSISTRLRYAMMLKTRQFMAENIINDEEAAVRAENAYLRYMGQTPSDRALKQRGKKYTGTSLPREYP